MNEKHVGSDFDDFLREEGLLEEAEAVAAERIQNRPATPGIRGAEALEARAWNVRHLAPYADVSKIRVAGRARNGDPEALRIVLRDLAAFLESGKELEPAFASLCIDALNAFTTHSKVWYDAAAEFRGLDFSNVSPASAVTGFGPRVSEAMLRRSGSAFCRGFFLSKPQGKGEKYHFLLTPGIAWRVFDLRLYGASLTRAIRIARSGLDTELSDWQIKEWLRRASWLRLDQPGTWGFFCGAHQRRLKLATWVLHRTVRGMGREEACEEVAKLAVTELCFLPTATVFLAPKTVMEAYEYASRCRDARWPRVERLVNRFARRELQKGQLEPTTP